MKMCWWACSHTLRDEDVCEAAAHQHIMCGGMHTLRDEDAHQHICWGVHAANTLRDEDVLMGMRPHMLRDEDVLMGMRPHTKRWRCVDGHAATHFICPSTHLQRCPSTHLCWWACSHTLRDEDVLMGMQPHTKRCVAAAHQHIFMCWWACSHTLRDEDVLMGMHATH